MCKKYKGNINCLNISMFMFVLVLLSAAPYGVLYALPERQH